jgi:hypothetical protein
MLLRVASACPRRGWRRVVGPGMLLLVASACADILGIDDGIPRNVDASVPDVFVADVVVLPDVVVDAGIDVPTSPMACGTSSCNALTEACCRLGDPSDASGETFLCVTDAAACAKGLLATCVGPDNCTALGHPGDTCCGIIPDGGGVVTKATCVPAKTCTGAILCGPGDDEACDVDGQTCKPSIASALGFLICKT